MSKEQQQLTVEQRIQVFYNEIQKVFGLLEAREFFKVEEILKNVLPPPIGTNLDLELFEPVDPHVKELEFDSILDEMYWSEVKKEVVKKPVIRCAAAYHYYVFSLFERQQYERALEVSEIILKRSPLKIDTRTERLQILKHMKDIGRVRQEALNCFAFCWRSGDIASLFRNMAFVHVEWKEWDIAVACLLRSLGFQKSRLALDELSYIAAKTQVTAQQLLSGWSPERVESVLKASGVPLGPSPVWEQLANDLMGQAREFKDIHQLLFATRALYELTGAEKYLTEANSLEETIKQLNIQPNTQLDYIKKITLYQQLIYDTPAPKADLGPTTGINERDSSYRTALHRACEGSELETAKALLQKGASVHVYDKNTWSPLHCAAAAKSVDLVNLLVDSGSDVTQPTNSQATTLHYVARIARDEAQVVTIITKMVAKGASPNAKNTTGMSPLHEAAFQGVPAVIWVLIRHGAAPDQVDKYGETPLHYATRANNIDNMKALLEAGATPDIEGKRGTPLQIAERPEAVTLITSYMKK